MTEPAAKNLGGRPLKFKTVEELQIRIDAYFESRKATRKEPYGKPTTITGLALWLDTTRETLCDYQAKDGFSDTVTRAKMRVEEYYESRLVHAHANGSVFALKNIGNWVDKSTLAGDEKQPLIINRVQF